MSSNTRFLLVFALIFWVGKVYGQPLCENNPSFLTNAPQTLCLDNNGSTWVSIIISNLGADGTYEINYPDGIDTMLVDISGVATISHLYNFDCADMPGNPISPGDNDPFGSFGYFTRITRTDCVDEFGVANFDNIKFNVIPNPLNGFTYSDPNCLSTPFPVEFTGDICNRDLIDEFFWYVNDELVGDTLNLVHNFPGPGIYEVEFAVTDHFDCDTFSVTQNIEITAQPFANATLQIDSTELCSPNFTVDINNTSQYADTFTWTTTSSGVSFSNETAENPTITINNTQAGNYTFELCADNSDCDPNCRPFTITTFEQQMIDTIPGEVLCTQTVVETCNFMEFSPIPQEITWTSPDADIMEGTDTLLCALVEVPDADNFTLIVEGKNSCDQIFADTITIPLVDSPEVTITPPDTLCEIDTLINILDFVTPADRIESCDPPGCQFNPLSNVGGNMITLTDSCGGIYPFVITVLSSSGFTGVEPTVCAGVPFDLSTLQTGAYTGNEVNDNIFLSNAIGFFDVHFTDTTYCEGQSDFMVEVVAEPIAAFDFMGSCVDDSYVLPANQPIQITNTSGVPLIDYIILETNEIITTDMLPPLPPGTYTIQQTVGISDDCSDTTSQEIIVESGISPNIQIAIDSTECDSIYIDLNAIPFIEGYEYEWTSDNIEIEDIPNPNIVIPRPNTEDTLMINLTVSAFCDTLQVIDTILLPVRFEASFDILNINDEACSEETIYLQNTSINYESAVIVNEDGSTSPFPDSLVFTNNSDTTRLIPITIQGFSGNCPPSSYTDTVRILPVGVSPAFSVDYDTLACAPLTVTVTNSTVPFEADSRIYWGDGSTPQPIETGKMQMHTYDFPRDTTITLMMVSRLCGVDTFYQNITINANPNIDFTYIPIDGQCESNNIQFAAMGDVSQEHAVSWDFGDGNTSLLLNPIHYYAEAGVYNVNLTVTDSITLCQSSYTDSIEILGYNGPALSIEAPTELCVNNVFELNILSSSGEIRIDYGDSMTITNTPITIPYTQAGTYNLNISTTDINGCEQDTSLWINVVNTITADIIPDLNEIAVEFGESAILDFTVEPTRSITHTWLGEAIGDSTNRQINISPTNEGYYYLNVKDEYGCIAEDSILVRVTKNYRGNIFVPNIFSPNTDGINDLFYIHAKPDMVETIKTFQVFDRWGEKIFENNDGKPNDSDYGWDGMYKGEYLNPAVFVWLAEIEFKDGNTITCQGDITLIK